MREDLLRVGGTSIHGRPPRRKHSLEKKRQIAEESFVPGASVSVVARRHDVNANQVFTWRRQYRRGELSGLTVPSSDFVPVGVIGSDGSLTVEKAKAVPIARAVPVAPKVIELSLRHGTQVRIEGDVRLPVLQCVLDAVLGLS